MNDGSGPRGRRPTSRSTAASPRRSSSGSRQETGRRHRARAGLLLPLRARRTSRGSSRTSTTTSRSSPSDGVAGGGDGADRLRLRPHGGHLRPRHRGAGDRRASSACRRPRAATAGVDPRFVAAVRDLLLERAAVERGEDVARAAVGGLDAAVGPLPGRAAAPTRAAPRPALCGRRTRDRATPTRGAARPRPRRRPGRPPSWSASARRGGVDGRRHQVQRRRRRHRGRPGQRGADPRGCSRERRPDDAFLGEEGDDEPGTSGVRWVVDPIDGTVNFLYGLPAVRRLDRRRGRRRGGRRRGAQRRHRHRVRRRPRRDGAAGATRDGVPIARPRPGAAGRSGWSRTGFSYDAGLREHPGRARWRACCRRSATSAGSAPARSTCATSPRAALDAYVEEGVQPLGLRRGRPGRPDRRGPHRADHGGRRAAT